MNGELAHAVALALHGTAWLSDPTGPPPTLDGGPTARYLRHVGFVFEDDRVAEGVDGWLSWLRDRGVGRIGLVAPESELRQVGGAPVQDHLLVAFAGAGRWALVTRDRPPDTLVSPARWEGGDRGAPDQRIWDVTYTGQSVGPMRRSDKPVLAAAEDLRTALVDVEAFARAQGDGWWGDAFAAAIAGFSMAEPAFPYYPDAIPAGLGLQRRRLAAVAAASWVFGGMGSWNDLGFEQPEVQATYDRLTARLYRAVLDAFVAVVNA
ncbi:MAG: hypothetical protein ACTHN0_12290 [Aquihabitans sp.]